MGWSPRRRTLIYCTIVAAVAAGIYLSFLGLHPMSGDEPLYAMCVDHMRDGTPRAVLSPTPYPPVPYFQKPPLYMWLTATTYDLFPRDSVVKYRVWSAVFGILAVTGTCLLGAALLSPEAGLIAALLLLTNDDWVRNHGVLTGTFDTGLTLACLACFLMYWSWTQRKSPGWIWPAIGLVCAAASLMKPAFGVLPIGLLGAHAAILDRRRTPREKSLGLATAAAITVIGAGWWFLLQYHRFGAEYLDQVFRRNIVGRISEGLSPHHVKQAWYYLIRVSQSSCTFALAFVALAWTAWRAAKDPARREPFAYLALLAWGWIALFSVSASKYLHYAYPVFPVIAVCTAAMLITAGDWLRRHAEWGATVAPLCVAVLIGLDLFRMADGMSSDARRFYAPHAAAQALRPAQDAGRCRVILYRFPESVARWMSVTALDLEAKDAFYLSHLRADRASTAADLRRLLDRPALLIVSRFNDLAALEKDLDLPARDDERFAFASDTIVMYGVDLRRLLHAHAAPGHPNDTVRTVRVNDDAVVHLELAPALHTGGRVTITATIPGAGAERLKYLLYVNGIPTQTPRTRSAGGDVHLFTFELDEKNWSAAAPTTPIDVVLQNRHPLTVTDVALDLDVRVGAKR